MNTIQLLMAFGGILVQILIAINKVLIDKNFDLQYWWDHNKLATIVAAVFTVAGSYVLTTQGYDVTSSVGIILNIVLGYVTMSMSHHLLRVKAT